MKTVKLIAIDLDGTLVREDQSISAQDIEAIARAQRAGVPVVIATGRIFPSAMDAFSSLEINTPVICSNGADIRFENKTIYSQNIDNNWLREAYVAVEPFSSHRFIYCGDNIYCEEGTVHQELFRKWGFIGAHKDIVVFCSNEDDLMQTVGDRSAKFMACMKNESMHEKIKKTIGAFGYFDDVLGETLQFEMTRKGVNKATALEFLVNRMGLTMQDVLAIGDSTNDLEMIRRVGTGVAMGNAMDELLAAADGVTLPVWENGVAHAIEKYVLQKEPCGVAFAG